MEGGKRYKRVDWEAELEAIVIEHLSIIDPQSPAPHHKETSRLLIQLHHHGQWLDLLGSDPGN